MIRAPLLVLVLVVEDDDDDDDEERRIYIISIAAPKKVYNTAASALLLRHDCHDVKRAVDFSFCDCGFESPLTSGVKAFAVMMRCDAIRCDGEMYLLEAVAPRQYNRKSNTVM